MGQSVDATTNLQRIGMSPAESLRILCLDGGVIKGYTTLLILKRIFRTLKDTAGLEEESKPCEVFDLILGIPTGGIIAIMLGQLSMTIDECLEKYEIVGNKVLSKKPVGGNAGRVIRGLFSSPFYSIDSLQQYIREVPEEREIPVRAEILKSATLRLQLNGC